MAQYIDKDAIVTEIERLREQDYPCYTFEESTGYYNALDEIASFINTLEVKAVNLEKEYEEFVVNDPVYNKLVNGIVGKAIAKYFYSLGLRVVQNNS